MGTENTEGPRAAGMTWRRAVTTYVLGGILAWGLIGWGLDFLLHTRWIWIVGAVLGAGGGYYLARLHRDDRAPGRGAEEKS
ncbi:hypothetical protein GCM10023081_20810 [Arthrobacter ginkgonis]|uniref:AtpZ/AtpI family protein n=1 Tax=Arthrobacter ginkgonis TaxID=1630594 RepID=A0ABP7CBB8_9MICC